MPLPPYEWFLIQSEEYYIITLHKITNKLFCLLLHCWIAHGTRRGSRNNFLFPKEMLKTDLCKTVFSSSSGRPSGDHMMQAHVTVPEPNVQPVARLIQTCLCVYFEPTAIHLLADALERYAPSMETRYKHLKSLWTHSLLSDKIPNN